MCVLEQVGMVGRGGSVVLHIQERGFMFKVSNSLKKSAKVWSDTLAEASVKIVRKHLDIPENKYPFIWWSIDELQWVINS